MTSFRSEKMALCQFFLLSDAAYSCVAELGELGLVQFRDLNKKMNNFQRKFVNEIRRCEEMERVLRYLNKQIMKDNIAPRPAKDNPEAPNPKEIVDLEAILENLEYEIRGDNKNTKALQTNYLKLTELKNVLQKTDTLFDEMPLQETNEDSALLSEEGRQNNMQGLQLCFFAGTIRQDRLQAFERMIWRISLGNIFLRQTSVAKPIRDPRTGYLEHKSVFIIFFQGETLKKKVEAICTGFHVSLYPCPEDAAQRRAMAIDVMERMHDLYTILKQTLEHRNRVLKATAKNLHEWCIKVQKMKAIYATINMFEVNTTEKFFIAEGWLPVKNMDEIHLALQRGALRVGSPTRPIINVIETNETPPTYHCSNKFTSGFQALINAYGIGSYLEINPTPYTIITFPFLFAIMFGDIGHGIIMSLFALWMCVCEKKLIAQNIQSEVWDYFFGGRYILLLMGLFSIYTGIIYNDIFSKSLNVFGSKWSINTTQFKDANPNKSHEISLDPASSEYYGKPYELGMDPVWQLAENKILFHNSFKMKISIIVGIIQMLFGVCLSLLNHIYFRQKINIIAEFIPQILFISCLFLYMVMLMFIKWFLYYSTDEPSEVKSSEFCAPLILITFINMVLFKETVVPNECDIQMYSGQMILQKVLVFLALICVPWMLLLKPLYIMRQKRIQSIMNPSDENITTEEDANKTAKTSEEHGMGEIFIHQSIHTIEYVLGCVSHTASYLRLWALSLAHGQLSDVLWNMVLRKGLISFATLSIVVRVIFLYLVFMAWAVFTVSILVLMEGLSAFLHCLRLHWVEFQSKFYAGSGVGFFPFTFKPFLKCNLDAQLSS